MGAVALHERNIMTSYDLRKLKAIATRAKLAALVAHGVATGTFKVLKDITHEGEEHPSWFSIVDDGGRVFSLGAPWGGDGRISCAVGCVAGPQGVNFSVRDVMRYGTQAIEAKASADKTPEALWKEFSRRVLQNPEAREQANALRDYAAARFADCAGLDGHIKALEALGYVCGRRDSYYKVHMHKPGAAISSLEVMHNGSITVDRLSFDLDKLGAVLAALN